METLIYVNFLTFLWCPVVFSPLFTVETRCLTHVASAPAECSQNQDPDPHRTSQVSWGRGTPPPCSVGSFWSPGTSPPGSLEKIRPILNVLLSGAPPWSYDLLPKTSVRHPKIISYPPSVYLLLTQASPHRVLPEEAGWAVLPRPQRPSSQMRVSLWPLVPWSFQIISCMGLWKLF